MVTFMGRFLGSNVSSRFHTRITQLTNSMRNYTVTNGTGRNHLGRNILFNVRTTGTISNSRTTIKPVLVEPIFETITRATQDSIMTNNRGPTVSRSGHPGLPAKANNTNFSRINGLRGMTVPTKTADQDTSQPRNFKSKGHSVKEPHQFRHQIALPTTEQPPSPVP